MNLYVLKPVHSSLCCFCVLLINCFIFLFHSKSRTLSRNRTQKVMKVKRVKLEVPYLEHHVMWFHHFQNVNYVMNI